MSTTLERVGGDRSEPHTKNVTLPSTQKFDGKKRKKKGRRWDNKLFRSGGCWPVSSTVERVLELSAATDMSSLIRGICGLTIEIKVKMFYGFDTTQRRMRRKRASGALFIIGKIPLCSGLGGKILIAIEIYTSIRVEQWGEQKLKRFVEWIHTFC